MKNLTRMMVFTITMTICALTNAQTIIDFGNTGIKDLLIDDGHDDNNDGEIDSLEALDVTTMNVFSSDGVYRLENIQALTNLVSIRILDYNNVSTINLEGLPNFTTLIIEDQGINHLTLKDLPEMTTLDADQNSYMVSAHIENCPKLVKGNASFNNASRLTIIDAPLYEGYRTFGKSTVFLKNTGAPVNQLATFGTSIGISTTGDFHVENVNGVNKVSLSYFEEAKLRVLDNDSLTEILIDSDCAFDSLDFSSNRNLEDFTWRKNNSVPYEDAKIVGANYLSLAGLQHLHTFDKASDAHIQEIEMGALPVLEYLQLGSVNITELHSDSFPALKYLYVDNYIQRLEVKDHANIIELHAHKYSNLNYEPEYLELGNCAELHYVNFRNDFSPDTIILYDLPKHQDKEDGWSNTLSTVNFAETSNLNYLELRNIANFEDLKSNSSGEFYDFSSLETVLIEGIEFYTANVFFNALNLKHVDIQGSALSSLELCGATKLEYCDVTGNDHLTCVCIADASVAESSSDFLKDNHTDWNEVSCDDAFSSADVHHVNLKVFPNPTQDMLFLGETIIGDIQLFDLEGRNVLSTSNTDHLDLSILSNGIYYLQTDKLTQRVLKQ